MSAWVVIAAVVAGLFAIVTWILGARANKKIRTEDHEQRRVERVADDERRAADLEREDKLRQEAARAGRLAQWQGTRLDLYGKCAERANEIARLGSKAAVTVASSMLAGSKASPTAVDLSRELETAQGELNALSGRLMIVAGNVDEIRRALLELRRGAANLALQLPHLHEHDVVDPGAAYNAQRCVSAADALLKVMRDDLGLDG